MLKSPAKQFAMFGLKTWVCPACGTALKYYKILKGALAYGDMLWDKANGIVPRDPPDPRVPADRQPVAAAGAAAARRADRGGAGTSYRDVIIHWNGKTWTRSDSRQ